MSTTREANKEARREAYQRHLEFEADLKSKGITEISITPKFSGYTQTYLATKVEMATCSVCGENCQHVTLVDEKEHFCSECGVVGEYTVEMIAMLDNLIPIGS